MAYTLSTLRTYTRDLTGIYTTDIISDDLLGRWINEAYFEVGAPSENELPGQRPRILDEIADGTIGLQGQWMAKDVDAVEQLITSLVRASRGANH